MLMPGPQSRVTGQVPYTGLLLALEMDILKQQLQNTYLFPPLGPSNLASPAD